MFCLYRLQQENEKISHHYDADNININILIILITKLVIIVIINEACSDHLNVTSIKININKIKRIIMYNIYSDRKKTNIVGRAV